MVSVASQLIEEVTAHAQRDSREDAREICTDGTYFLSNLHKMTDKFILQSFGHFLLYSKVSIKFLNEQLTGHICIVS